METPHFLLNQEKLKQNYFEFDNLCKKHLKDYKIAYSVKTNSDKNIVKILSELGSGFDISSEKEMELISKKSFAVFNGCCKKQHELNMAIKNNFIINVDSISEMHKISKRKIGIRISLGKSKFGFEKEKIKQTIDFANSKNLKVNCLHFHFGTNLTLKKFEENLKQVPNLIKDLELDYLDLGGGFPDEFQLKNMGIKLENYFELIEKYLENFKGIFILEPGRNLVSDAFELITKVCVIKQKDDKNYAVLDAGINILQKITLSNFQFELIEKRGKSSKEFILAGPLLFSNDTLGKIRGDIKEGDLIRIKNVGAYCYNLAWEISYDKPKVYIK